MKLSMMLIALLLVPCRAQDPVPSLCYQVRLLGPKARHGAGRRKVHDMETQYRNEEPVIVHEQWKYHHDKSQNNSACHPLARNTVNHNKSYLAKSLNLEIVKCICGTVVGWASAAVGAEPPETTITPK